MIVVKFVAVVLIGYLVGSIPFGVLISKRLAKVDVREYGSGKIGTTNVLRVAGKKAAALVVALDVLKGALAVLFAGLIFRGEYWIIGGSGLWWLVRSTPVVAALAAMAGHNWSVFLKFRGGRGVATIFGGLVALFPLAALFGGEIFVIGTGLSKFVSLGSIAAVVSTYAVLVPLTIVNGFPIEYLIYALIGAVVILVTHRSNIARLLRGRERRLGDKAEERQPKTKSAG